MSSLPNPALLRSLLLGAVLVAALVAGGPSLAAPTDPPTADRVGVASDPAALGLAEPPALAPPDPETAKAEAERIADGLRCPVCQGLSVADSNADAAVAMYARIAELVRLGYSQEQIEDYFVDRYGEWVRLDPPVEGLHWLLWVAPALLAVVGAAAIALRARGQAPTPARLPAGTPTSGGAPAAAASAGEGADPADRHRAAVLAALGEDGR
jgi:cytochrome c-type biogenesis protein CcmH